MTKKQKYPRPCPNHKKCTFRYLCEVSPGIFKYWSGYKQICVKKHQSTISKQISDSKPIRMRKWANVERMKVVDENGRELSNVELRRRFGQGKGVRV